MERYLSVITNFGCHGKCPYCITKGADLDIPKSTVEGLSGLAEAIRVYDANWISISGGGDPLHDFANHGDWWAELFRQVSTACITRESRRYTYPMHFELHTSYLDIPMFFAAYFARIVYHLRDVNDIRKVHSDFNSQTVRVVFVVTEDFTPEKINEIVAEVKKNPCISELSFRQMVDGNFQPTHYCEDYLKAGHRKDWWYIEQGDYNLYFCEGKVSTRFEDFKKENNHD